jgi:hypothetical protein
MLTDSIGTRSPSLSACSVPPREQGIRRRPVRNNEMLFFSKFITFGAPGELCYCVRDINRAVNCLCMRSHSKYRAEGYFRTHERPRCTAAEGRRTPPLNISVPFLWTIQPVIIPLQCVPHSRPVKGEGGIWNEYLRIYLRTSPQMNIGNKGAERRETRDAATLENYKLHSKIWGSHGGDYEEWCLLGCYAVWLL